MLDLFVCWQIEDLREKLEEAEKRAFENLEVSSTKDNQYGKQVRLVSLFLKCLLEKWGHIVIGRCGCYLLFLVSFCIADCCKSNVLQHLFSFCTVKLTP